MADEQRAAGDAVSTRQIHHGYKPPAGFGAGGDADRHAVGQWPAGDHEVALVKVVAQLPVEGKAIGVDPECDGGLRRVQSIDDLAEGRARGQRLLGRLAAVGGRGFHNPLGQDQLRVGLAALEPVA